jgi:outer membrane lipoprotein carrier protein
MMTHMLGRISAVLALALSLAGCGAPDSGDSGRDQPRTAADAGAVGAVAAAPADRGAAHGRATSDSRPTATSRSGPNPSDAGSTSAFDSPGSTTGETIAYDPQARRDAESILARAESAYGGIRSMQADFVQRVTIPLLGQTQRSRGTIYHKRPDRLLMRFSDPAGDIVVADGRYLWMYYPSTDDRQVIRTLLARGGQSVDLHREFLSDAVNRFEVAHAGTEQVGGRATDVLALVPRELAPYTRVRIWVDRDDSLVRRFEIHEPNESVRWIELSGLQPNIALSDQLFSFTPPAGVEIFEP